MDLLHKLGKPGVKGVDVSPRLLSIDYTGLYSEKTLSPKKKIRRVQHGIPPSWP